MERGWKNGTNTTTTLYKTAMCTGLKMAKTCFAIVKKNLF